MRCVVLSGAGQARIEQRSEPKPDVGALVIEIDYCALGGSDVEAFASGEAPSPAWFGHQWSGRVVAVGDTTEEHFVGEHFEGERVLGAVPPPCGRCRPCRAGLGRHCDLVVDMIVGTDRLASDHGAFAERIRVDARRVHRVPEAIDQASAALVEPAAVASHAIHRSGIEFGDVVAVVGAGTVGLLMAEMARIAGASAVVIVDPDPSRRELACDLGADAAFGTSLDVGRWLAERSHGLGADVVLDGAARGDSLAVSISLVRRGGIVVAVGVRTVRQDPVAPGLIEREIDLRASLGYEIADVRRVLALMVDERLRVAPLCASRPVSLGELPKLLEAAVSGDIQSRTYLVTPSG